MALNQTFDISKALQNNIKAVTKYKDTSSEELLLRRKADNAMLAGKRIENLQRLWDLVKQDGKDMKWEEYAFLVKTVPTALDTIFGKKKAEQFYHVEDIYEKLIQVKPKFLCFKNLPYNYLLGCLE